MQNYIVQNYIPLLVIAVVVIFFGIRAVHSSGKRRQDRARAAHTRADAFDFFRHLCENGAQIRFSSGEAPDIGLNEGEEVLCAVSHTGLLEAREISTSSGGYAGPSFRVAEGVSFGLGGYSGSTESHDEFRLVDQGTLVLTN